jgi:arylsulfatase A-like enzyme
LVLNLIVICIDSLRQDHVGYYAGEGCPTRTPHIDALAAESVVFDNMYPEALPTIPIRTQLMTGQRTLGTRPWQPLHASDRTIAEILGETGYVSALITDAWHYFKPGYNFHRGFSVWRWIRGQEYDPYRSQPLSRLQLEHFVKDSFSGFWKALVLRFLQNVEPFQTTEDWFCAQLTREAVDWLEANRSQERLFLWFDSFDPHEPWFPPQEFDTYTSPDYQGRRIILPMGGPASDHLEPEEIAYTRALYAGEVAYVDHCVGSLLQRIKELGLWDTSLIVLLADHGHPLADHGKFLKGGDRLYNELLKIPFMVRFPQCEHAGRRVEALAQFHDLLPTVLSALRVPYDPEAIQGHNLMSIIQGARHQVRDSIITGFYAAPDRCIRSTDWSLILRPDGDHELYDLHHDPLERTNLFEQNRALAGELAGHYGEFYRTPPTMTEGQGTQGRYEVSGASIPPTHPLFRW